MQEKDKDTEQKEAEFFYEMSASVQENVNKIINDMAIKASESGISITDVAWILGSAITSCLYEMLREENQRGGFIKDQEESMNSFKETIMQAVEEHIKFIKDIPTNSEKMPDTTIDAVINKKQLLH